MKVRFWRRGASLRARELLRRFWAATRPAFVRRRAPRPARRRSGRERRARRWRNLLVPLALLCGLLGAALLGLRFAQHRAPARLAGLPALLAPVDLEELSDAITEMDVGRARRLAETYQRASLSVAQSHRLTIERARLGLYVGDCDAAQAILGSVSQEDPEVAGLANLAQSCAGAVAASRVVEDEKRGLWLRVQDSDDLPLVPFLMDVAERAREAVRVELGVELPRPLRIDVVRDLFSLSGVSGLPLSAAETTGTVAVARWGRVTLLSPRASRHGFPWQDTLAHELVHLALSRATRDFAPLWLQEGVAKRQEQRWRAPRPFDDPKGHDLMAQRALLSGNSVGVNNLGSSIAMLPSADAASIAFSEVTSFMNYWIAQNGRAAFRMLLRDLGGLADRDPNAALRSVTGYTLEEWILRWQTQLRAQEFPEPAASSSGPAPDLSSVRVGDLLLHEQYFAAAAQRFEAALRLAPKASALRFRTSGAALAAGQRDVAVERLGQVEDLDGPHAGWFALRGRFEAEAGHAEGAELNSTLALSLDPWSELVACEGYQGALLGADPWQLRDPPDPVRRELCFMARARAPVQ